MTRTQFLLDRRQGIGGSDVAAIMGISPWKTPLDVYKDKVCTFVEDEPNEDMKRGSMAEKYVLEEYADRTGSTIQTNLETIIHSDYPFMRVNVDARLVDENVIVEAKSTKAPSSTWDSGIPEYYKTQVAYYAMITNATRVDIPVLFSGWTYGCFTYWRDAELEAKILKAVIAFWQDHIVPEIPPAPQSQEELQAAYPTIDDRVVVKADANIAHTVEEYQGVLEQIKELETSKSALKKNIQLYMGEAGVLDAGFCKLSLKDRVVNRLDTTALKASLPDIYNNYVKETQSRFLQFMRG